MTHTTRTFARTNRAWFAAVIALAGTATPLTAQPDAEVVADLQPEPPAQPAGEPGDQPALPLVQPIAPPVVAPEAPVIPQVDPRGRRIDPGEPTTLSFRNVTVEQIVPFIVESTGKVIFPQQDILARRITLLNDKPIPRTAALELVFAALQQTGVAVVETQDLIVLCDQGQIDKQAVPVVGPEESLLGRTDIGTIVSKIYALREASAAMVGEAIKPTVNTDLAKIAVDPDSNQIVVTGPVSLLQRLERLITSLDKPAAASLVTETFHIKHADAEAIAQNIRDLFSATGQTGQAGGNTARQAAQQIANQARQQLTGQGGNRGGQGNQQPGQGGAATTANLRVTSNTQTNSITVMAEQSVIDEVRKQILENWDKPLPEEQVVPRVYDLKNSDPIKVKEVLDGLFGAGTQTQVGQQFGQRTTALTPGVGRLAGQFSFQALPEAGRLVVVAKSASNLDVIDKFIQELDQPITSGMPEIIELKHASAEDLAEQLNALLAQDGTRAQLRRSETDLTESGATTSPFARETTAGDTANQTATQNQANANTTITFWWQQARQTTDSAGASNLVAKARIVPVSRSNSVMVLAPAEYKRAIVDMITALDKPGRQVLIAAIIAEIANEDGTALGLRFSNSAITPRFQDNAVSIGANTTQNANNQVITGQQNNIFPSLFDTSVLDVGVDLNVLLQALAQNTEVRILSEPRVFTGDNIEAEFFDGQDVPFITDSQTTDNGGLTQSFDYRAVGLQLRVRPRITPERDVDLKVNLQLANLEPNQTIFGGFIVNRRETTTQLIVRDGQTVVISGIMRAEDSDVKRKVPFFGDLPIVGGLFTSIEAVKSNTELVAFITPIVINNRQEMDSLNAEDRNRLQHLRTRIQGEGAPEGAPPARGPVTEPAPAAPDAPAQP